MIYYPKKFYLKNHLNLCRFNHILAIQFFLGSVMLTYFLHFYGLER